MSDTNTSLARPLLNVILVLIESVLTLLLRFDADLRKVAYPLAQKGVVVAIRTYLPHTQVYATFSSKGVLLDDELPIGAAQADVVINAYSFQLFNALVGHNPASVDALQIRGESAQVEDIKAFLLQVGVGGVVQNLLYKIKGKPQTPEQKQAQKENKLATLTQALSEKTQEAEQLSIDNRRLTTQLIEAQHKQKSTKTALIVAIVIALLALISHFIW